MRQIKNPTGFSAEDILSWGTSSLVYLDTQSNTVIKSPRSEDCEANIKIERTIYERFGEKGGHKGLLQYLGPFETGIRLEFASNQGLLQYLRKRDSNISLKQRLRWCEELSSTLFFIHSNNVIHGDLTCNNVFLDGELHAKVADFGGSSLDGSDLMIMVTASHRHPGALNSIEGDIFALGSCFFEILTGQAPYAGRDEDGIMGLWSESKFPATAGLGPMDDIIQSCWQGKCSSAYDVWMRIRAIQRPPNSLRDSPYACLSLAAAIAISTVCLFTVYKRGLLHL